MRPIRFSCADTLRLAPTDIAGRILDLYERRWQGRSLRSDEFVLFTDEKTSIQARRRCHPTLPPAPGSAMRVESEYERRGAWAYLAALDVHPRAAMAILRAAVSKE